MHILYVDESGDPGIHQYGSPYFILSGLIVSQENWQTYLDRLKVFRTALKNRYGLNVREEIHASELIRINKLKAYRAIKKSDRIEILKACCDQLPIIFDTAKVVNICLTKNNFSTAEDVQLTAWNRLIQRFDTYLKKDVMDKGIIISDDTDGIKISRFLRKMRIYSPVSSHFGGFYNSPVNNIIEDLFQRTSSHSYFIQVVDVISHVLYRKEHVKGSLRKFQLEKQFDKFDPILLKKAAKNDPLGVVRK